MRRLFLLVTAAASTLLAGCVEGEVVYTLNPDGSGKVKLDLISAPGGLELAFSKSKDPDDWLRALVGNQLSKGGQGVTGWSDVSGEFLKDGRFRYRATAYFKNIDDLRMDIAGRLKLVRGADGALTVRIEDPSKKPGKEELPPDFAKMTDAEWDKYLLKERILGQSAKPIFAILAEVKVKLTVHLPGQVTDLQQFKPAGDTGVFLVMDGAAIAKEHMRRLAMSDEEMRKQIRSSKSGRLFADERSEAALFLEGPVSATVAKPGGPQFDYAKEVAAAVAGNAELRKKYRLPDAQRLPGEAPKGFGDGPKKGFGPAPPPPPPPPPPPKP
jgi:hypothetical protein